MHPAAFAEKVGTLFTTFLPGPLLCLLFLGYFLDFSLSLVGDWVQVLGPLPPRPPFSVFFSSSSGCLGSSSLVVFSLGGWENPPGSECRDS